MAERTLPQGGLYEALVERGMSRRTFLKFCSATAAVLALPTPFASRIAAALKTARPLPLVWLHGQACGGDSAAFLASASPTTAELLLTLLSIDYQETLMAASGATATSALAATVGAGSGYLAVVEGSVPLGADGMYCLLGGRPFANVANEVTRHALATIAVGSCAVDGGVAGAHNGVSGAVGVGVLPPGSPLVNMPGCPVNVDNLAATIVHYLTFHELPPMDSGRRPLFAYGGLIHNQCERRAHFEFGEFATEWGDAGAQQGWCLYKLGCKGPETFGNCPTKRFAEATSWPVLAGHGCIGCTMPRFWDTMLPAYRRLPGPIPFVPTVTADQVGLGLVGGVAALTGVHGIASYARARLSPATVAPQNAPGEPAGEALEPPAADAAQADGWLAAVQAGLETPPKVEPGQPPYGRAERAEGLVVGPAEPGAAPGAEPAEARPEPEGEPETEPEGEPEDEPETEPETEPEGKPPRAAPAESPGLPPGGSTAAKPAGTAPSPADEGSSES